MLLTILPFQASWAAVAVYCQHEQVTAPHFGHHEHQHEQAHADDEQNGGSMTLHADCVACHGLAAAFVIPMADTSTFPSLAQAYLSSTSYLKSILPTRPEKPQWSLAV